ncbi:MAG: hypothetical protein EAZ11_01650 [Curvibacter sp.]|nr:MAG: hypothetical protein EAZ11_01650 [Curvibacter sp.]
MRRLVLLLILIALVPLRTWAGDAMAIQMAAQASAASLSTAANPPSAHSDCHEMQAEPVSAPLAGTTADPCATCASCQACFTVGIAIFPRQATTPPLPHGLPQASNAHFTSAVLALGHKPPIS